MIGPLVLAMLAVQEPLDTALRWEAAAHYGFEVYTRGRAAWNTVAATAGGRRGRAVVLAEAQRVDRFGRSDLAGALEAYVTLNRRTYGYARAQLAPGAEVVPRADLTVELYHAARRGWEASAGYRRMQFRDSAVDIFSAGVVRYTGPWYLRLRASLVPASAATTGGAALAARRYFETVDDLVELAAALGTELVLLRPGFFEQRRTDVIAARARHRIGERWGLETSVSRSGQDGIPARSGLTIGVFARW